MKKQIFVSFSIFLSVPLFGQIGINNTTPAATLDITAKSTSGPQPEGILIPRISRLKAMSMANVQTSTLIYINDITSGSLSGTAVNIDKEGYYYYNGTEWSKLGALLPAASSSITFNGTAFERAALTGDVTAPANNNATTIAANAVTSSKILDNTIINADLASGTGGLYKGSGSLAGPTTVSQGGSSLAWQSTATTGTNHFSVDGTKTPGTALSLNLENDRIGIGTTTPLGIMDITSSNSALILSRNTNLGSTITAPVEGMIAYEANTQSIRYYNGVNWLTLGALTKNEGAVRIDGYGTTLTKKVLNNVSGNTLITFPTPLYFGITQWPENAPALQSSIYNTANNRFLDNNVEGQTNIWRVSASYTKSIGISNQVRLTLRNPANNFSVTSSDVTPAIATSGILTFYLITVSTTSSIANGYEMSISSSDTLSTLTIENILRVSNRKD